MRRRDPGQRRRHPRDLESQRTQQAGGPSSEAPRQEDAEAESGPTTTRKAGRRRRGELCGGIRRRVRRQRLLYTRRRRHDIQWRLHQLVAQPRAVYRIRWSEFQTSLGCHLLGELLQEELISEIRRSGCFEYTSRACCLGLQTCSRLCRTPGKT
jgi:hypothetical protein